MARPHITKKKSALASLRNRDDNVIMALNKRCYLPAKQYYIGPRPLNSPLRPPPKRRRAGSGSGSQTGHMHPGRGGGAATARLGSLPRGLIKRPPGLNRGLSQGTGRCPIHLKLLANPGKAQDKRFRSPGPGPQVHFEFRNWSTLHQICRSRKVVGLSLSVQGAPCPFCRGPPCPPSGSCNGLIPHTLGAMAVEQDMVGSLNPTVDRWGS